MNRMKCVTSVFAASFLVIAMSVWTQTASADYANPHLLTSTSELESLVGQSDVRIVDVRPRDAYNKGHIPGAVHLGADDIIDPDSHVDGTLRSLDELASMLAERGIGKETRVVFYDDRGGFHASRLFWMLEYFGHRNASVLNGGYPLWEKEGRQVSTDEPKVEPATFALTLMSRKAATADWLLDRQDDASVVVIDVRPAKAYNKGHIPWAKSIPWAQNLAEDKTLKSADELLGHFESLGVTKDKNVAVHCQNGKAAAHSYFTLRLLGYPRVRSYDRSWAEWGSDDALPKVVEEQG